MAIVMPEDYAALASRTVAIKFPDTGRPMLLRSSYDEKTWDFMITQARLDRNTLSKLVRDDSPEGQEILMGTDPSLITAETLMKLGEIKIRALAERYGVKTTTKNSVKSIALKILSAIADGVRPQPEMEEMAASGE